MIAKLLSKNDFGIFSYYFTLSLALMVFIDYGFNLSLATRLKNNNEKNKKEFNDLFIAKMIFSIIVSILFISISYFMVNQRSEFFILNGLLLGNLFFSFTQFFSVKLRNEGKFDVESYISIVSVLVQLLAIFLVFRLNSVDGSHLNYIVVIITIVRLFQLIVTYRVLSLKMPVISRNEIKKAKSNIKENFSFAVHLIVGTLLFQIDTLVLKKYTTFETIADYQFLIKLVAILIIGTEALSNFLIPLINQKLIQSDFTEYLQWKKTVQNKIVYSSIALLLIFNVLCNLLLSLDYFNEYQSIKPLIPIVSISVFLRYFSLLRGIEFSIMNMQIERMLISLFTLCTHLLLLNILIPIYSVNGAIWSLNISLMFMVFLYEYKSKKIKY